MGGVNAGIAEVVGLAGELLRPCLLYCWFCCLLSSFSLVVVFVFFLEVIINLFQVMKGGFLGVALIRN